MVIGGGAFGVGAMVALSAGDYGTDRAVTGNFIMLGGVVVAGLGAFQWNSARSKIDLLEIQQIQGTSLSVPMGRNASLDLGRKYVQYRIEW